MIKLKNFLALTLTLGGAFFNIAQASTQGEISFELATSKLANVEACTRAYNALLKYQPVGISNSIEGKHLQSNKQTNKGYFAADSATDVYSNLSKANCIADSAKYVKETNVVECHLKCQEFIGDDVNLSDKASPTKNILLIYSANNKNLKQTFLIEVYPRENP